MMWTTTQDSAWPGERRLGRILWLETRAELLKLFRLPSYVLPTLGFPIFFYALFGMGFAAGRSAGAVPMATYLLATYGAFGIISASLFGFGVGIATERGQGWMLLKRASPMPAAAYFGGKLFMSLLFSVLIVVSLGVLAATGGKVSLPLAVWLRLGGTLVLGAVPFCALGLAIGSFVGPNSGPAVLNLINLPMAFCSGLWLPLEMLPSFFRGLAPWLPAYHFGQLALQSIGGGRGGATLGHLVYLAVFSGICIMMAAMGLRTQEDRSYG